MIVTSVIKKLRRSSPIKQKSLFLHVVKLTFFFSILVFFHEYLSFTGQQRKWEAIYLHHFYHFHCFTETQTLFGLLLVGAHLRAQLAAGLEPATFSFLTQVTNQKVTLSLESSYCTIGLTAVVAWGMLKIQVTLGNISRVLINLIKRFMFAMFKDSSPLPLVTQLKFIFSLQFTNHFLTFVSLRYQFGQCHDIYLRL